jgi:tRNA/rRNA methyltransferase
MIRDKGPAAARAAVVFGGEESGLSNPDIELCDCVSSVPLAASYPSLNLSQAVMLYAYVLSPLAAGEPVSGGILFGPAGPVPVSGEDDGMPYRALKRRIEALLGLLEFDEKDLIRKRILERMAPLPRDDIKLLHSLCARLEQKLKPLNKI